MLKKDFRKYTTVLFYSRQEINSNFFYNVNAPIIRNISVLSDTYNLLICMKRVRNMFQCDGPQSERFERSAITRSWIVASCDVDELSAARSRRLAKCRRKKCRRWFRSLLLCENSYTYEEYEVEEAEKVLGALRHATHFHSKFLNCTCNKLIRSLII